MFIMTIICNNIKVRVVYESLMVKRTAAFL